MQHYKTVVMDSSRWEGFEHRHGDIVISTPPKCGTTWMQMVVALLVFDGPRLPATLDVVSPWLDMCNRRIEDVRADLDAQTHRRFIKTHTPLDGLPLRDDVTYVIVGRDPRDVAISFEHHRANMDLDRFLVQRREVMGLDDIEGLHAPTPMTEGDADRTRAFVHGETYGTLGALLHHLDDAWQRQTTEHVVMVHYADLDADLPAEMLRVATALGFGTSPERIAELAPHATLTAMRARAGELAPAVTLGNWKDPAAFFRRGGRGEGSARMSAEELTDYDALVGARVDADLSAWIARGRAGIDPDRGSPGPAPAPSGPGGV